MGALRLLLGFLIVTPLPALAQNDQDLSIEDLEVLQENGVTPEEFTNLMQATNVILPTQPNYISPPTNQGMNYPEVVTNGESPGTFTSGSFPDVFTNGDTPSNVTRGNLPTSYMQGRLRSVKPNQSQEFPVPGDATRPQ